MALPFARKRGEAACLDVYPAVSVGLILVRRTGLHLGETFISGDGVNLHPSLPGLPLWRRGLRWGGSGQSTVRKIMTSGRENTKWRGERGGSACQDDRGAKIFGLRWSWLMDKGWKIHGAKKSKEGMRGNVAWWKMQKSVFIQAHV